jgi:hypothetical protein
VIVLSQVRLLREWSYAFYHPTRHHNQSRFLIYILRHQLPCHNLSTLSESRIYLIIPLISFASTNIFYPYIYAAICTQLAFCEVSIKPHTKVNRPLPTAPVPTTPVTGTSAPAITVSEPNCVVPTYACNGKTIALDITITVPVCPVASTPVGSTTAPAITVSSPS